MRIRLSSLLFVVLVAHAGAQTVSAAPDTTLVPWASLTERPHLRETPPVARVQLPSLLQDATLAGEVRLLVNVGADGVPDTDHARIESATISWFASTVLRTMQRWTLTPPTRDGRAVRTTMPVFASFPAVSDREVPTREIYSVEIDSTGLHIVVGRELIPPTPGLAANPGEQRSAFISILSELVTIAGRSRASGVCVALQDTSGAKLSTDVFRSLRAAHGQIRDRDHCPPTFASMILRTDASGKPIARPKGSVDPMWIFAPQPRLWTADHYVLLGSIGQGTGGIRYFCQALRVPTNVTWEAKCAVVASYVH